MLSKICLKTSLYENKFLQTIFLRKTFLYLITDSIGNRHYVVRNTRSRLHGPGAQLELFRFDVLLLHFFNHRGFG